MASGIKELHEFVRGTLPRKVLRAFRQFEILSEADLQSFVWMELRRFVRTLPHYSKKNIRVHCQRYVSTTERHIHPDIVVTRLDLPWIVMELKESWKRLKTTSAEKERDRLLECKDVHGAKRGYILHISRYGRDGELKSLTGPKGKGGRFLFEIPIVLEAELGCREAVDEWEGEFRKKAKCRLTVEE